MTLEQFSTILTVGVLMTFLAVLIMLLGYCFSQKAREGLRARGYYFFLGLSGLIAALSTVAVLYYQFVLGLAVCELCWWQRIFMFPIEVIVFIALWHREKAAHFAVGILAALGTCIAGYHYYNHFQNLVLGKSVILPCAQIGLVPSCSEFSFTIFGFMTLPGMALLAFLSILILVVLAHKTRDKS